MTGQLNKLLLLVVPLAPLAGSLFVGLFGTHFFNNRISRVFSQMLAITAILVSFLISLHVFIQTRDGATFNGPIYTWLELGGIHLEIGFLVDSLTALMMCVVTFISLMVHIYSVDYMHDDSGANRFFAYISLFTASMLLLVMSNNFLLLFIGWEAVGLTSYLLIGFWFERPSAIRAGLKAFLVNRMGDFGFILGIGLVFAYVGSLNYTAVFDFREDLANMILPGTDWNLVTVICICLFIGAMAKSAQFPLQVWLPDSMEGPTPISALIHAATMVTAGIFMVVRLSPLFELSNTALSFMLVVGGITALFFGIVAIVQSDIKRLIAFSTISQLGYMTVALGASAYTAAIFHLATHAFFKALLFLAAGSVILAMNHDQDIRNMGGLRKYMPVTAIVMCLASLSLAGFPFFSGFYSKESIVLALEKTSIFGADFAFKALLIGFFVTAFYAFRLYFLVFHGKERFDQARNHIENNTQYAESEGHVGLAPGKKPQQSPATMTLPLILLAVPSVILGFFAIRPLLAEDFFRSAIFVNDIAHPAMKLLAERFSDPVSMALQEIQHPASWLVVAGIVSAWLLYVAFPRVPSFLQRKLKYLHRFVESQFYLDIINDTIFVQGARLAGKILWQAGDVRLIDGLIVNGSARVVGWFSRIMRYLQTGYLYHYAFVMILALLCLLLYFVPFYR